MKSDLDRLMAARDLNTLIVVGGHDHNPPRDYLSNGVHITGGLVLKKRGSPPLLIVNPMEVEEAALSGLTVHTWNNLDWGKLVEQAQGDRSKAEVAFWGRCLERFEAAPGKVGLYGIGDVGAYLELIRRLETAYPQYQFTGELSSQSLFTEAYLTKDADELARLRKVAAGTSATLQATWDFIASHRAHNSEVVKENGQPLTIGDVKRFVRRTLLDHELQDNGMIFAQGRDGGFPHSRGVDSQPLRPGQAIVFDLFPSELGGGYHHDVTRTWCIGHASDEVQAAYDQVMAAFNIALDNFEVGMPARVLQEVVQDYFEASGHATLRSNPSTMDGYVHSLGHGVGLNIHERPTLSHLAQNDVLQVGNVISIEPGLYYPECGYGVRIEDLCVITETGDLQSLTNFHKQLVIPLQ